MMVILITASMKMQHSAFSPSSLLFLLGAVLATFIQYDKRREETFFNRQALYLPTREATQRLFFVFLAIPRPEYQQKKPRLTLGSKRDIDNI
jgi:hypothetical protein